MSFVENKISKPSLSIEKYFEEYKLSIDDPEKFWSDKASSLSWIKNFSTVKESTFNDDVNIKWFGGGSLNVSYNCIDRHLKERGNKVAIIWEADTPNESAHRTQHRAQIVLKVILKVCILKSLAG